ncbi:MAG: RNA methyltransferase [Gammaproteobacteria bacterium]
MAKLRFVLVRPTHPGNIGASARALKTMGLRRLFLVAPHRYPSADATAMAAGAADVLHETVICASPGEAVRGCTLVVGASARNRSIPWPTVSAREGASRIIEATARGEVAVLFGPEHSGLSNIEVELCQLLIKVPAAPECSSLNLAAAVQIVAYELRQTAISHHATADLTIERVATADEMARFYLHLENAMIDAGFLDPEKPRRLMRRMRRLFNRARLDQNELNILRGFLAAVQTKIKTKVPGELER